MNEPLLNLLEIYNDKDKVLRHYLPSQTVSKLNDYEYIKDPNTLFLNDRLLFVSKETGLYYRQGLIIKITDSHIMIKSKRGNISVKKDEYYIFILPRRNKIKKNNRKFYEELLKSLH